MIDGSEPTTGGLPTLRRKARAGVLALAFGCMTLAVAVPTQAADAFLYLDVAAKAAVASLDDGGTEVPEQSFGEVVGDCELVSTGIDDPELLVLNGTGGRGDGPGISSTGIGLARNSQGDPCGHVRLDESLTIALGDAVTSRAQGSRVVQAQLFLTILRNVRIRIEATGASGTDYYEVRRGFASRPTIAGYIGGKIVCPTGACPVTLTPPDGKSWTSIKLTTFEVQGGAEAGAWSLGNGRSTFTLGGFEPTGTFKCGDAGVEPGSGSIVRRLNNANAPSTVCPEGVDAYFAIEDGIVTFLVDYEQLETQSPGAIPAFALDVRWDKELVARTAQSLGTTDDYSSNPPLDGSVFVESVPLSVQRFGQVDDPEYFLDYCPGEPTYTQAVLRQPNGEPVDGDLGTPGVQTVPVFDKFGEPVLEIAGLTFPAGFEAVSANDMSGMDGFQHGCLANRRVEIVEDVESCPTTINEVPVTLGADAICVQVVEEIYLRGDYTTSRTGLR